MSCPRVLVGPGSRSLGNGASAAAAALCAAVLLAAPACSESSVGLRSTRVPARALRTDHTADDFVWGECDAFEHNVSGCSLAGDVRCSHRTDPGPEDADVAFELWGLPVSSPEREVHLHFWAARRSRAVYDPVASYLGVEWYSQAHEAYPLHWDADFNGGNVRVDEDGNATIKVRAPATYAVDGSIVYPHVHMRVCAGDSFVHARANSILITASGPVFRTGVLQQSHLGASYGTDGFVAEVPTEHTGENTNDQEDNGRPPTAVPDGDDAADPSAEVATGGSVEVGAAQGEAVTVLPAEASKPATTTAEPQVVPQVSAAPREKPEAEQLDQSRPKVTTQAKSQSATTSTARDTGSTGHSGKATAGVTPGSEASEESEVEDKGQQRSGRAEAIRGTVTSALRTLDMDALEFSPVYNCLLSGQLYDTRTSQCVLECIGRDVISLGQCVLPEVTGPLSSFTAAWRLTLDCEQGCWEDRANVTLHHVRLAVGSRLRVPFGEVSATFKATPPGRRRLGDGEGGQFSSSVLLGVSVQSHRLEVAGADADTAAAQLNDLLQNAAGAAFLLDLPVVGVGLVPHAEFVTPGEASGAQGGAAETTLSDATDPYTGAYEEAVMKVREKSEYKVVSSAGVGGVVPWHIAAPVLAVLAVGAFASGLLLRRRGRLCGLRKGDYAGRQDARGSSDGSWDVATVISGYPVRAPEDGVDKPPGDGAPEKGGIVTKGHPQTVEGMPCSEATFGQAVGPEPVGASAAELDVSGACDDHGRL